jgi:hypothetical protein
MSASAEAVNARPAERLPLGRTFPTILKADPLATYCNGSWVSGCGLMWVELVPCWPTGEGRRHANCSSPPCGTTRTRPPGPPRSPTAARAELFAAGAHQAEVARQLGVSAQAISVWSVRWPAIKQAPERRRACLVFFNETALSLTPNVPEPGRLEADHRP